MTGYTRNIVAPPASPAARTLIRGATVLSMDSETGNLARGDILIEGSTITSIKAHIEVDDAVVIDASGMIAMPGMVDTHRHAWEGQLRRINPNAQTLEDYCNATHYSFAKFYRPGDMYIGNLLTALGCIDAGITTVIDNSHNSRTGAHSDAAVEALLDAGIRSIHACGAPVSGDWDKAHWPGNLERLQQKYFKNADNSLVSLAMMAQLEPELWAEARRLGLPIVTEFFGADMATELAGLHRKGLLGPDNIFNHCTRAGRVASQRTARAGQHLQPLHCTAGRRLANPARGGCARERMSALRCALWHRGWNVRHAGRAASRYPPGTERR